MPLTVIVEDGTGKADANSYASVATADAYLDARPRSGAWKTIKGEDKSRLVVYATRILDASVVWFGAKFTETQALEHPRHPDDLDAAEVPQVIVFAVCELALALHLRDLTGESTLGAFKALEIGPLKFEANSDAARLPTIPTFVRDLIAAYGSPRASNINAKLVRV